MVAAGMREARAVVLQMVTHTRCTPFKKTTTSIGLVGTSHDTWSQARTRTRRSSTSLGWPPSLPLLGWVEGRATAGRPWPPCSVHKPGIEITNRHQTKKGLTLSIPMHMGRRDDGKGRGKGHRPAKKHKTQMESDWFFFFRLLCHM